MGGRSSIDAIWSSPFVTPKERKKKMKKNGGNVAKLGINVHG